MDPQGNGRLSTELSERAIYNTEAYRIRKAGGVAPTFDEWQAAGGLNGHERPEPMPTAMPNGQGGNGHPCPNPVALPSAAPPDSFADRLRAARERAGLSQSDLARELCVSRNTVGNYESHRTVPDLDQLAAIAEALDIAPASLLPDRFRDSPSRSLNLILDRETGRFYARTEADSLLIHRVAGSTAAFVPAGELVRLANAHGLAVVFWPSEVSHG